MNKLKTILISLSFTLSLSIVGLMGAAAAQAPVPATVADVSTSAACAGLDQVDATQSCGSKSSNLNGIISAVVNILSIIVGIAAVIMVVVAGFKYITSGGDSSSVSSAKNTLVYALVGLAVAALAHVLVQFVLGKSSDAATPPKPTASFAPIVRRYDA